MAKTHLLGSARIGEKRQLKFALEQYWRGELSESALQDTAAKVRATNFDKLGSLDFVQVGDFSFYDHVLDTSFMVGNAPARAVIENDSRLNDYFRVARGKANNESSCCNHAGEMTKWFDTNYHYIVPEFLATTEFSLHIEPLLKQLNQAKSIGATTKPIILGPVTYLWLGKSKDDGNRLELLDKLLPVYHALLKELHRHGVEWVQIDEPALVTDLAPEWQLAYRYAYNSLKSQSAKLLLTTYFGALKDNLKLASELPVAGLHLDALRAKEECFHLAQNQGREQVLSIGVIDGRNIWKTDLQNALDLVEPLAKVKGDALWLAPTCSLLHVPVDLTKERDLPAEISDWLAFGHQKIDELVVIASGIRFGRDSIEAQLDANQASLNRRRTSTLVNHDQTQRKLASIDLQRLDRVTCHAERAVKQNEYLALPSFPTTTIGSFPQTTEIRTLRRELKQGQLSQTAYQQRLEQEVKRIIEYQQAIGLDVLVHGEPERNDMVEYFGERLEGFIHTQFGWVQSYGSRCVKPPVIYGDVYRSNPLTLEWATYAQSLSSKPVKGMLTGPVTILNWSFVRDDQPRKQTCQQIALAIKEEVLALESNGISIIQIDEAALREGLPLRRSDWPSYLDWAIDSFKLCVNTVADTTQIHTHMCYSEFNDIIEAITRMDADVITIESSRSGHELLETFKKFRYPNQIGPGVYDIHSPNIPSIESIRTLIAQASDIIPHQQLWVNPDCGLKTRAWHEVQPALANMVAAARQLRAAS